MSCAYCDLPEITAREIFRNQTVRVFPTNIPIVPGHVLICPVRHVGEITALTPAEQAGMLAAVTRLRPVLRELYGATGFNFAWNEGAVAGQSVPHLHLHMLPRKDGDAGITEYDPRRFLYRPGSREASPEDELQAVAAQIRQALDG